MKQVKDSGCCTSRWLTRSTAPISQIFNAPSQVSSDILSTLALHQTKVIVKRIILNVYDHSHFKSQPRSSVVYIITLLDKKFTLLFFIQTHRWYDIKRVYPKEFLFQRKSLLMFPFLPGRVTCSIPVYVTNATVWFSNWSCLATGLWWCLI